jgi:hypothetical protein
MSFFYNNLAQEDTKNTKKKKQMRVNNAIVLKKDPILKKRL